MRKLLNELNACQEAKDWVGTKTQRQAWQECERGDWLLWLAAKQEGRPGWPDRKQIVKAACACAETVLHLFEEKYPNDGRPRKAIEVARAWAEDKATLDEVILAAAAAGTGTGYAFGLGHGDRPKPDRASG